MPVNALSPLGRTRPERAGGRHFARTGDHGAPRRPDRAADRGATLGALLAAARALPSRSSRP